MGPEASAMCKCYNFLVVFYLAANVYIYVDVFTYICLEG